MTTDLLPSSLRRLPAAAPRARYKHPLRGPRYQPRRYVIHLHDLRPGLWPRSTASGEPTTPNPAAA